MAYPYGAGGEKAEKPSGWATDGDAHTAAERKSQEVSEIIDLCSPVSVRKISDWSLYSADYTSIQRE